LAVDLHNTKQDLNLIVAHALAAVTIAFQIGSSHLERLLAGLWKEMSVHGGRTRLPASFDELCEQVEKVPGVRLRALFERIAERSSNGNRTLNQVMQLATQPPDTTSTTE
jgi:hypothetical protein